jgi:two-component system, LuxR family, sensor kinase FixL
MLSFFLQRNRTQLLIRAGLMVAIVALIDWRVEGNVFFGFLYLFPMLMLGNCLLPWQLAIVAAGCAFLAECLGPDSWTPQAGIPRDIFMFTAYFGTGLFAYESARNRELALRHSREIEQEVESRREAEQQLKALIESSPAAILTLDSAGKILMANQAAHRLLGFEPDSMPSQSIVPFLPLLARVPPADGSSPSFRTAMQCRGRRRDGEVFLADLWFSTYQTRSGPRLAAMLVDSSDTLRDREESSLQQLLASSRLVIGALSHEIRNMCGAISVVSTNLSRYPGMAESEDFRALRNLVTGLATMAASQLQQSAGSQELSSVDLDSVLDELRIVIEPELRDSGISFQCHIPVDLPRVWADRQKLLQVLVNLTKNSERALAEQQRKEIIITATADAGRVILRVRDTGPGIPEPERLFRPFQPGAEMTGLGLYLSRAFSRAFGADLRYEGGGMGCCFAIDLTAVVEPSDDQTGSEENGQGQDSLTGRSCSISRGPKPAYRERT